jgi:hypothetical protein
VQEKEAVGMIRHPAGLERRRFQVVQDARHVGVEARADFRGDGWFTVFRAEDQMNQNFGKRLGHAG